MSAIIGDPAGGRHRRPRRPHGVVKAGDLGACGAQTNIAILWRYNPSTVTVTATIRVPRETRDSLAARARERGVSLSSLLTEFARRAERAEALRSEREATRAEAGDPEALAEYRLWEATLGDGVD